MSLKGEMSTLQIVIGLVILIVVALLLITVTSKQVTTQVGGVSEESEGAIGKIGELIRNIEVPDLKDNEIVEEGSDDKISETGETSKSQDEWVVERDD